MACSTPPKVVDKAHQEESTISHKPEDQPVHLTENEPDMLESDLGNAMGLQTIHFEFDSFELKSDAKEVLLANVEILRKNPNIKIKIEGHCDQRGTIQYNLALGEKRAHIVRRAMVHHHHIAHDRVSTISYGKEKLLDSNDTEEAFAKNRRANFVIHAQ
jgi:peptidoglycan-associated lipoprotein